MKIVKEGKDIKFKIKGEITQIIPPEKHDSFVLGNKHNQDMLSGWYIVLIEKPEIAELSWLKRMILSFTDAKFTWDVLMMECPYKVGEVVEIEIHEYFARTEWLCTEKFEQQHTYSLVVQ